jgi:hypothetical protein
MQNVNDWIGYLEMLQKEGFDSYEVYFEELHKVLDAAPIHPLVDRWTRFVGELESRGAESEQMEISEFLKLLKICPKETPVIVYLHPTR